MPATTQVRPLPAEVREKLCKLMLLLSSDHDGERANAAAAIMRALKAAGLDMQDLVGALTTAPAAPPQPPPPPDDDDNASMAAGKLAEIITTISARRRFNAASEGFLDCLLARTRQYRNVFLSPKQTAWLQDLMHQAGVHR